VKKALFLFIFLTITHFSNGQGSSLLPADSINKGRIVATSCAIGTVWTGTIIGLSAVWYKDVEKTNWHTFDDSRNWLQMDKVGHFYTAHKINMLTSEHYMWSGINRKTSTLIGAGISFGYQTTLEMLDAYSKEWGFSWTDFMSNLGGVGFYSAQQLIWEEERIIPKFSFHQTVYATMRPEILGSNYLESLFKDYNGQTYWLSVNPSTFFNKSKLPEWLCLSFGYSVEGKIIGDEEIAFHLDQPIYAKREFLFSLDVDFSRIPTKRRWQHVVLKQLNYLKIPFPSLVLSDGKIGFNPFYF